jgi:hypothetical protein
MMLYMLALNPLLQTLYRNKGGVRILNHVESATVYVDDVTIFLNSCQDLTSTTRTLQEYSHASGAQINTAKSKALPLGGWYTSVNICNIHYHRENIRNLLLCKHTRNLRLKLETEYTEYHEGVARNINP